MWGALRRLFSRDRTKHPPALSSEAKRELGDVFKRARIEPSAEDWRWGASAWAQGARGKALDRFLASRLAIQREQQEESA